MTRWTIVWVVVVGVAACANNVPQDRATGPDGKQRGARSIELADGEGRARGIVTYPGGDRVDWKRLVLPDGKRGRLEVKLTYTTPRPGLKLAFDVFDQWNHPVMKTTTRGRGRVRRASIDRATGTYYIRIYAPRRGDAGAYRLSAAFHEDPPPITGVGELEIPDPPRLADIPDPPSTCAVFDPNDPVCAGRCPPGAPPTWQGCAPPPSTAVVAAPPLTPTPAPAPAPAASPVVGRVLKVEITQGGLELTIAGGSAHGVGKGWRADVLRGTTDVPLAGGSGKILRVNKQTTIVLVSLTKDVVSANPTVQLSP